MKKLMLILLGLVFMSASILAQGVTAITADSHVLGARKTYYEYTPAAGDTCGTEQDTVYFEILANKNVVLSVNARVEATRAGTGEIFGMTLEGKVFENGTYVKIDSINTGVIAGSFGYELNEQSTSLVDSINQATINSGASDNFYRYFRIMVTNDGSSPAADLFTPTKIIFKFYER